MTRPKPEPPYVQAFNSSGRHRYYYYRRKGWPRERLPDNWAKRQLRVAEIERAIADEAQRSARPRAIPGTYGDLVDRLRTDPEWLATTADHRKKFDRYLDWIVKRWGTLPVKGTTRQGVKTLLLRYRGQPTNQRRMKQALSKLYNWGAAEDSALYGESNPARGVSLRKLTPRDEWVEPRGYPSWPDEVLERVLEAAPAHLRQALSFVVLTGQRPGDASRRVWGDVKGDRLTGIETKRGKTLSIKLYAPLAALLREIKDGQAATPLPSVPIIRQPGGRPWSTTALDRATRTLMLALPQQDPVFRERYGDDPGFTPHGLRRHQIHALYKAGCKPREIEAITRQSLKTIEHYLADLDREALADSAVEKLLGGLSGNGNRP